MFDWASTLDYLRRAASAPQGLFNPRTKALLAAALLLLAPFYGVAASDPARQQKAPASSSAATSAGTTQPALTAGEAHHNHAGQPVPDYMTGDQCLFCHRSVVGPTWQQEPHAWTIRPVGIAPVVGQLPADATHIIGSAQHYRALKLIGYGKFALLAADGKTWQPDVFATQCAGCHATGVDPQVHTFASFAFDCFACHGDLSTDHTTKPEIALLGSKRPRDPKEIVEICASCHLRGGHSESTGLPYPNNFIAGDDLFADFKVDLKRDLDPTMNPADRHAYTYTRKVMEGSTQTCLECHRVHGSPDLKHEYCIDCDDPPGGKAAAPKLRSQTCEY
ncbi:MAG TPA: hypothetical protein VIX19_21530 [Terriglobales bacterium]